LIILFGNLKNGGVVELGRVRGVKGVLMIEEEELFFFFFFGKGWGLNEEDKENESTFASKAIPLGTG